MQEKVFRGHFTEKTIDYGEITVKKAKKGSSGAGEMSQALRAFAFPEVLGPIPSIHMTVYSHL